MASLLAFRRSKTREHSAQRPAHSSKRSSTVRSPEGGVHPLAEEGHDGVGRVMSNACPPSCQGAQHGQETPVGLAKNSLRDWAAGAPRPGRCRRKTYVARRAQTSKPGRLHGRGRRAVKVPSRLGRAIIMNGRAARCSAFRSMRWPPLPAAGIVIPCSRGPATPARSPSAGEHRGQPHRGRGPVGADDHGLVDFARSARRAGRAWRRRSYGSGGGAHGSVLPGPGVGELGVEAAALTLWMTSSAVRPWGMSAPSPRTGWMSRPRIGMARASTASSRPTRARA